jgi:hypothetical protein
MSNDSNTPARHDVHIDNESLGWVITSASLAGRPTRDFDVQGGKTWKAALADGVFIPVALQQDDAFNVRIVLDGGLTPEEEAQWVDRFSAPLDLADGVLALCAGTDLLHGFTGEAGRTHRCPVQPGRYLVEIFTFLHGINGTACLAKAGVRDAGLRRYIDTTRRGETPADWMWAVLGETPPRDPAEVEREARHAEAMNTSWRVWPEDAQLSIAGRTSERVDFLIRLSTLKAEPEPAKLKGGWYSAVQAPRKPAHFPAGIKADLPAEPTELPSTGLRLREDIEALVRHREPVLVEQGPVVLSLAEELALPHWLAWLCNSGTIAQLRIDLRGAAFDAAWPGPASGIAVDRTDEGYVIDLEVLHFNTDNLRRMLRIAGLLAALPDGTWLTMNLARPVNEGLAIPVPAGQPGFESGLHRYQGEVRAGEWRITHAWPAIPAGQLQQGLELARQVDRGGPIVAASEAEAQAIMAYALKHSANFQYRAMRNPERLPQLEGKALHCTHVGDLADLGQYALRVRFPDVWSCLDLAW